jgi:excisionase family DNA binding protein
VSGSTSTESTNNLPAALTVAEVGDALRCSTRTVRNLISSGELAAFHVGTGSRVLRVTPQALDSYIASKSVVQGEVA